MKRLIEFIFGVRVEGEKLSPFRAPQVREIDFNDYQEWCKEFNVGCRTDRRNLVHF